MMTDLDVVYLAVASADRPVSSAEIGSIADMERDAVSKALHYLYKEGRIIRTEAPNPAAGRNGQKSIMFVYAPANTPTGDDSSPVAEAKPTKAKQQADGWTDEAIRAAALRPRPRWLITPIGKTFDNRESAVDEATRLATSDGTAFAVCRVEAVATVKVEIAWE